MIGTVAAVARVGGVRCLRSNTLKKRFHILRCYFEVSSEEICLDKGQCHKISYFLKIGLHVCDVCTSGRMKTVA